MCCCRDKSAERPQKSQKKNVESDYLLPGSRFDPSVSENGGSFKGKRRWGNWQASRNKSGSKKSSVTHSVVGMDSPNEYEPPVVPASQNLPTYEEFRLLKTVGRGAFGKVCTVDTRTVSTNT